MGTNTFVGKLNNGFEIDPKENVFTSVWKEYERVIVESLITSFGLDFLVGDVQGGDVDTIHNVRQDSFYKNKQNESDYSNRGEYDRDAYHQNNIIYKNMTSKAKKDFNEKGQWQNDGYVEGNKVAYNKSLPEGRRAELDHVIAAKQIHDDPGRVLAGLNGEDLANNADNLIFTNSKLNNNMRDKTPEEYIAWCRANPDKVNYKGNKGEPLPSEVEDKLREEYSKSLKAYNAKVNRSYYTSKKFATDLSLAASTRGAQMGLRQALGYVFSEVWFVTKAEIQNLPSGSELKEIIEAVGVGIKKGFESAKNKYKDIISKYIDGFGAGALASLTTTICNIFFTTAKNLVRCIRQMYASVIQAGKVILFNPDNLMLGDRIKSATVIMATGASVLVGTVVGEMISKTPIGVIPVIGDIVQVFCSTLVSGLISCSLLICLDRSKLMNKVINALNAIPSEVSNFAEIALAMEYLAAKIGELDIDKFKKDTEKYSNKASLIAACDNDDSLNSLLKTAYVDFGIAIPWLGDFDSFMGKKTNKLVFE